MNKKIVMFDDIKIKKRKYHYQKNSVLIDDVNIDKILISNKVSCD